MHLNDKKAFQIIGHAVMIILTLFAMLPLILILMASLTDDTALIQDGLQGSDTADEIFRQPAVKHDP